MKTGWCHFWRFERRKLISQYNLVHPFSKEKLDEERLQFQITDITGSIRFLPVIAPVLRHGVCLLIWRNTVCSVYINVFHSKKNIIECEICEIYADITLKPYSDELIYIITQMLKSFYLIKRKWVNEVSVEFTKEIIFADCKGGMYEALYK
ncbi:MAG: hypothetical protein K2J32_06725 [Ruminococcus sp.]|nr:hypothetical protein [Ruminococcus sp.]